MSNPLDRRKLEDLLVTYSKLSTASVPEEEVRKYAEFLVEVTSITGKVNSDSPKMFQLIQFFEKHHKGQKVILIANTYKRDQPSARAGKQDFTQPVVEFLKLRQVCAMTCVTLFELWKLAVKDQARVRKLILETKGELRV
jgi:hypothetical protein